MAQILPSFLKVGLLGFWSLWLTVVLATNIFDALKAWGLLPEGWRWFSGNYLIIRKAVPLPAWAVGVLFGGVLLWEAAGVVLFWYALYHYTIAGPGALGEVSVAFGVTLGLWAAFMVCDEILRLYQYQGTHLLLFIGQLLSLLAIFLLP
jgi:hypothetical protein